MSARSANYNKRSSETWVRVMCPECGAGGSNPLFSRQPKCHVCYVDDKEVLMLPASNNETECTWEEAQEYRKEF